MVFPFKKKICIPHAYSHHIPGKKGSKKIRRNVEFRSPSRANPRKPHRRLLIGRLNVAATAAGHGNGMDNDLPAEEIKWDR